MTALEEKSLDDLGWLLNSRYWNPDKSSLSESQQAELRRMIEAGRKERQTLLEASADIKVALLSAAMKDGTAKFVPRGTSYPKETADVKYTIQHGSDLGDYVVEFKKTEHPEVWNADEAFASRLNTLLDSVLSFMDSCSQTSNKNKKK